MPDTSHFLLSTCARKDGGGLKDVARSLDRLRVGALSERKPTGDAFSDTISEYFSQRHEFEKAEALNRVQRFSIAS